MTYIAHDTVKTAAVIDARGWLGRVADWFKAAMAPRTRHEIDPRNDHLLRDVGLLADGEVNDSNPLSYSMIGSNIRFIDLFLINHLDRGPR